MFNIRDYPANADFWFHFQSNYYQLDPDSLDYDRRVRKRRARLLAATEEAFESVRRVNDLGGKGECRRNQLECKL